MEYLPIFRRQFFLVDHDLKNLQYYYDERGNAFLTTYLKNRKENIFIKIKLAKFIFQNG